ncbi:unnamed protein product [Cylindrotheca closterium]|uniref:CCHC-type domain-containing protein n=1 Tax=Cylindrotheca closterium TaxID=2856 RepID=A0AAD2CYB1_9STRA|nr:unnamed protein product [Cylindrotheca closterium]
MHFKEQFLRQAEVMQDLYGVAWFRNFAVKTKAYAAIASTDTTAKDKFKDDIFEAVLATGFLCNCDQTRTAPLMLDLQRNYCREVDYYPKTVSKAQDMLKILMDVIKNPGVNLYQGKDQPNKGKGKGKGKPKDKKKKAACYVCGKEDHMSPKCPDRLLPESQWKHPKHYVDYGKKLNLKACTIVRGTIHRYLGMTLDFLVKGKLKIRMDDYVKNMLEDFLSSSTRIQSRKHQLVTIYWRLGKESYSMLSTVKSFILLLQGDFMSLRELVWISIQRLLFLPREFENLHSLIGRSVFA